MNNKDYLQASVFSPENLLREARRQKNIPFGDIPAVCVLKQIKLHAFSCHGLVVWGILTILILA